ncbi:MAG: LAGLIDADG family homing endonuclease, partial [archaeon]
MRLTENLAEFIGILLGDGGIYKNKNRGNSIEISGGLDDFCYLNGYVRNLIKQLFGIESKVIRRKNRNEILLRIYSNRLFRFLTEELCLWYGKKDNIGIPEIIKKSSDKYIFAFLRGLTDTDFGYMFKRGGEWPSIETAFKSKQLVLDLKEILSVYGITCWTRTDYVAHYKNRTWITNEIELTGKANFIRWIKLIGSSHPKNQKKISNWMDK